MTWYKKLEEMVEHSKDYTESVYIDADEDEGITVISPLRNGKSTSGWGETLSDAVSDCYKSWKKNT